jgi:hypothetical protein
MTYHPSLPLKAYLLLDYFHPVWGILLWNIYISMSNFSAKSGLAAKLFDFQRNI